MQRMVYLFVLALVVGLVPVFADYGPVGPPIPEHSWGQYWEEFAGGQSFDQIVISWVSGTDSFEPPTFRNFSDGSWTQGADSSTQSVALGNATTDLYFNIDFTGSPKGSVVFDLWAYDGNTVVNSATFANNSSLTGASIEGPYDFGGGVNWEWTTNDDKPHFPEPGALLLLGIMSTLGLGVPALWLRRK